MAAPAPAPSYRRHRYPAEIIAHCVWLYYCLPLSYRQVELLMAQRGIEVTYETVCRWRRTFGQQYANELRHRRPKPGDKRHLDEVLLKINGKTKHLWRAVDQDGNVLDILVQSRRNERAAEKFFRKQLRVYEYVPRVLTTDKLGNYGAAKKRLLPGVEHRAYKGLNNRAENSHRPTRQRERAQQRFKSPGEAQRFLAAFEPISGHFRLRGHRVGAAAQRRKRRRRFQVWDEVTGVRPAA